MSRAAARGDGRCAMQACGFRHSSRTAPHGPLLETSLLQVRPSLYDPALTPPWIGQRSILKSRSTLKMRWVSGPGVPPGRDGLQCPKQGLVFTFRRNRRGEPVPPHALRKNGSPGCSSCHDHPRNNRELPPDTTPGPSRQGQTKDLSSRRRVINRKTGTVLPRVFGLAMLLNTCFGHLGIEIDLSEPVVHPITDLK